MCAPGGVSVSIRENLKILLREWYAPKSHIVLSRKAASKPKQCRRNLVIGALYRFSAMCRAFITRRCQSAAHKSQAAPNPSGATRPLRSLRGHAARLLPTQTWQQFSKVRNRTQADAGRLISPPLRDTCAKLERVAIKQRCRFTLLIKRVESCIYHGLRKQSAQSERDKLR